MMLRHRLFQNCVRSEVHNHCARSRVLSFVFGAEFCLFLVVSAISVTRECTERYGEYRAESLSRNST